LNIFDIYEIGPNVDWILYVNLQTKNSIENHQRGFAIDLNFCGPYRKPLLLLGLVPSRRSRFNQASQVAMGDKEPVSFTSYNGDFLGKIQYQQ